MATVYVTYAVPAAAVAAAEAAVGPYLLGPGAVFAVPLCPHPGPANAAATFFGGCAAVADSGGLYAALPALAVGVPGAMYRVISPWRDYNPTADWHGWLAAAGLQVGKVS